MSIFTYISVEIVKFMDCFSSIQHNDKIVVIMKNSKKLGFNAFTVKIKIQVKRLFVKSK